MDDTQSSNLSATSGQVSSSQMANGDDQSSQSQDQSWQPSGGPAEKEPFPAKPLVPELVASPEQPVELEPELEQAGVATSHPEPKISEELKQAGVMPSTPAPAAAAPKPEIKLPIDPEKAKQLTQGSFFLKDPSSSLLWLAMTVLRQLQMKKEEEK